jgi:hypothetical protein
MIYDQVYQIFSFLLKNFSSNLISKYHENLLCVKKKKKRNFKNRNAFKEEFIEMKNVQN